MVHNYLYHLSFLDGHDVYTWILINVADVYLKDLTYKNIVLNGSLESVQRLRIGRGVEMLVQEEVSFLH